MCVSLRGGRLFVAGNFAKDVEAFAAGRPSGNEVVAQVVKPKVLQAGIRAYPLPYFLKTDKVVTGLRSRNDVGISGQPWQ